MLKRLMILVALLVALCGSALASEALCVCAPGVVALTDVAGVERIENGRFEAIFTVREDALYAAGGRGAYRLYDVEGNAMGEETFSMICDEGDSLVFRRDGLYGAMNAHGEVILQARYTQLTGDGAGGWLALYGDPLDERADEIIHIDSTGEERKTGVHTACALERVCCDRMPFMASNGLYGAVDGNGVIAVAPMWRCVGAYEDGLAKVAGPDGAGLIDAMGNIVVAPVYTWLDRGAAMIAACRGDRLDVFSPDGRTKRFTLNGEGIEAALAGDCLWLTVGGACRLCNADGAVLAKGSSKMTFRAGLRGQIVASDGQWGEACQWLIGPDGSTASGRFQQILPLCANRYAWMKMDGVAYYSEELGRLQRSWDYESMRYGLMDGAGKPLLPAEYDEIRALSEDRLLLIREGTVQLADLNGAVLRTWINAGSEAPTAEAGA